MFARSLAVLLLLAACDSAPVTFPVRPPEPGAVRWAFIRRATADQAGPGAIDCGAAKDQKTAKAVYACAEKLFPRHRPFYWTASSAGWYSPGNGCLYIVSAERRGRARVRLAYDDARESPPLRVGGLVRSPRWREGERAIVSAGSGGIRGVVIVEALISREGSVEATRVLKPLPGESTAAAEELVRRMRFHPATFLGRPVSVFWNLTVPVRPAPNAVAGETIPRRHPL